MSQLFLHTSPPSLKIPVIINTTIWESLIEFLQKNFPTHSVFMVGDSHVMSIYGDEARHHLQRHPSFRRVYEFPAGERSKSRRQKAHLEDRLLTENAGRDTVLLAFGGGVTGDLVGYVASSLHRGIHLIHLPTTVIAQVDSSIGGKVGINHPMGKNLLGSFYQAAAVFINTGFLQTLRREEFLNGMAEVIKYAVTLDPDLWDLLDGEHKKILDRDPALLDKFVRRSVELKLKVVEQDEKEADYRSLLNFGHTVGHAIEQLSHYRIKHGFAVGAGMIAAGILSHQLFGYPATRLNRLRKTLDLYELDRIDINQYDFDDIWRIILRDKKAREQQPRFTLLNDTGKPLLFQSVSPEELRSALAAC